MCIRDSTWLLRADHACGRWTARPAYTGGTTTGAHTPRAQRSAQPLHGAPWGVTAAVTTALARLAFVPISRTRQAPCGRQPRAAAASIVLDIAPMQHRSADHGAH